MHAVWIFFHLFFVFIPITSSCFSPLNLITVWHLSGFLFFPFLFRCFHCFFSILSHQELCAHPNPIVVSGFSDSESETEMHGCERPSMRTPVDSHANLVNMDLVNANVSGADKLHGLLSLLRQCCYRILVCLTAILSEANRHKPRTKRRATRLLPRALITGTEVRPTTGYEWETLTSVFLTAVNPVLHCLTVFPDWHALHHQVLLCIIELTNLCPVGSLFCWIRLFVPVLFSCDF